MSASVNGRELNGKSSFYKACASQVSWLLTWQSTHPELDIYWYIFIQEGFKMPCVRILTYAFAVFFCPSPQIRTKTLKLAAFASIFYSLKVYCTMHAFIWQPSLYGFVKMFYCTVMAELLIFFSLKNWAAVEKLGIMLLKKTQVKKEDYKKGWHTKSEIPLLFLGI